ncbi:unnamed protein product [Prunus armeniaca]
MAMTLIELWSAGTGSDYGKAGARRFRLPLFISIHHLCKRIAQGRVGPTPSPSSSFPSTTYEYYRNYYCKAINCLQTSPSTIEANNANGLSGVIVPNCFSL